MNAGREEYHMKEVCSLLDEMPNQGPGAPDVLIIQSLELNDKFVEFKSIRDNLTTTLLMAHQTNRKIDLAHILWSV